MVAAGAAKLALDVARGFCCAAPVPRPDELAAAALLQKLIE
jgi:hypothetical protein